MRVEIPARGAVSMRVSPFPYIFPWGYDGVGDWHDGRPTGSFATDTSKALGRALACPTTKSTSASGTTTTCPTRNAGEGRMAVDSTARACMTQTHRAGVVAVRNLRKR